MRGLWLFLVIGGACLLGVPAFAKEELGPDGFPKDWTPADFQIGHVSASEAVSGAGGIVKPWKQGKISPKGQGASLNIEQLPHVKASIPGASAPTPTVPAVVVSATFVPEVGPVPSDINALGAYGPLSAERGVGADVWHGVSFPEAKALLARLSAEGRDSLLMRRMVRRVLLTRADPPAGAEGAVWLLARADTLRQLGYFEAAHGLLGHIPDRLRAADPALAKAWTESQLLAGNNQSACAFAGGQVINAPAEAFWPMTVMVCQVMEGLSDGKMDKLALGLQLVSPEQKKAYAPLITLLEAVRDGKTVSPALSKGPMMPLMAAVYAAYPALIDGAVMEALPDIIWRRLLQTTALPLSLRTPAAERLADRSELPADGVALGVLYGAFTFSADQMADPVGASKALVEAGRPFEARALLWRVAVDKDLPESLRSSAWQFWRSYMLANGMGGVVRLMGVGGLKPSDGLAWMVPLVMRDALLAGDEAVAAAWWPSLRDNKTVSAELARDKPLLAMLAAGFKADKPLWDEWEKANLAETGLPKGLSGRADLSLVLAVLEEEGVVLPDGIWGRLAAVQGKVPARVPDDLAARKVMQGMVDRGEKGRVLLTMALAVGKEGMAGLSAEQAVWTIKTLKMYGFFKESRALAAEAVLPSMMPVARPVPKVLVNGLKKLGASGQEIGGGRVVVPSGNDGLILPPPRALPAKKR